MRDGLRGGGDLLGLFGDLQTGLADLLHGGVGLLVGRHLLSGEGGLFSGGSQNLHRGGVEIFGRGARLRGHAPQPGHHLIQAVREFSQFVVALAGGFLGQIPFSDGGHELLEFAQRAGDGTVRRESQ